MRAEATQRRLRHFRRSADGEEGEEKNEHERDDVVVGKAGIAKVEERPIVGGLCRRRPRDHRHRRDGVAGRRCAGKRRDGRSVGEHRFIAVEDVQDRLRPEGRAEHRIDLRHQPGLAVVVVQNEDPVRTQVISNGLEGFDREQERLEPQVSRGTDERERIRQREDDHVVVLGRGSQECPAVVDIPAHARVGVWPQGMLVHADLLDCRVYLDGIDVLGPVLQSHRDIVAGPGPDDQHVVVGTPGEPLVYLEVRLVGWLAGPHGLMGNAVDGYAGRRQPGRVQALVQVDSVIGRPRGARASLKQREIQHSDDGDAADRRPRAEPGAEAEEQQEDRHHCEPGERRSPQRRQDGKAGDTGHRTQDVEGICLERRLALEERTQRQRQSRHHRCNQDKDHGQHDVVRVGR